MKTLREAARADELNEKVKMNEDPSDFPEIFKKSSGSKIIQWFEKDVVGSAMENDFNTPFSEIEKNSKGLSDEDNPDRDDEAFQAGTEEINYILDKTIQFFSKEIRERFKH